MSKSTNKRAKRRTESCAAATSSGNSICNLSAHENKPPAYNTHPGDTPLPILEKIGLVHLVEVVPNGASSARSRLDSRDAVRDGAPVASGLVVVSLLFFIWDGDGALAGEGSDDDLVLIIGRRNMIPCILRPDVGIESEESVVWLSSRRQRRNWFACLEPKGGFPEIWATDEVFFGCIPGCG